MITPFKDMRATDISPELQIEYFIEPKYINKLINGNTQFIVGERGSGKTTILGHLENMFNQDEAHDHVAVYFRFEIARMKSLYNQNMSQEENVMGFSQTIVVMLGKLLCEALIQIRDKASIVYEREGELCEAIYRLFYKKNEEWEKSLYGLCKAFEEIRLDIWHGIRDNKVPVCLSYVDLLDVFVSEMRKEKCYSKTSVCILLDEYENITPIQQRVINSMVKDAGYHLIYKICMRPEGLRTALTLSDHEQLMEIHDYDPVDYVRDIIGGEADKRELIWQMCRQRLKIFYMTNGISFQETDLDIENYLEIVDANEEIGRIENLEWFRRETVEQINDIVGYKVPGELLDKIDDITDLYLLCVVLRKKYNFEEAYNEILSKGKKYNGWKHNYGRNITYIILDYYEMTKIFCGLDTIIKLSHDNFRRILWILHYAFGEREETDSLYPRVTAECQDEAIRKVSNGFYEEINSIPFYGPRIEALVDSLGSLFRSFILDPQVKKFEVNHFSIRKGGLLQEKEQEIIQNVLRDATMWGVFIAEKTNKAKSNGRKYLVYNNSDYILNPILAPYYEISYRKKQKCEIYDNDFLNMMKIMRATELTDLRKKLLEEFTNNKQISIWEYMDGTV